MLTLQRLLIARNITPLMLPPRLLVVRIKELLRHYPVPMLAQRLLIARNFISYPANVSPTSFNCTKNYPANVSSSSFNRINQYLTNVGPTLFNRANHYPANVSPRPKYSLLITEIITSLITLALSLSHDDI